MYIYKAIRILSWVISVIEM